MGDSETVIAQTSAVMGYTAAVYNTTGYSDSSSHIAPDTGVVHSEATTGIPAPVAPAEATHLMPGGNNVGDGNAFSVDSDSHMQESHPYATYEAEPAVGVADVGGNVASNEHESMASSQAAGYDSSANGIATSGAGTVSSVGNGDSSDNMAGSVDAQQFLDGSGMSFVHVVLAQVTINL